MIGQTIAHFRITEKLGSGGMGVVYAAEDLKLGRNVALKFLPESLARNAAALDRFHREARAASTLNHPNICTIYEIGEHEGQVFLAMELLEGRTLRALIAEHPLPQEQWRDIAIQISSALEAAHAKGIIHRDIKPANIMITSQGQVKLLDFGLAKVAIPTSEATVEQLTMAGAVIGTLAYMSPEQRIGAQTDARSDLYSLGATLYEMATGRLPVEGDRPVLPVLLAPIIYHCLQKDPAVRYQTAGELLQDLKRVGPAGGTIKSARRGLVAVALFLIAALLAAGGWLWRRNRQIRWATETALPQVMQFADTDENFAAFALARQIERLVPRDPILSRIWPQISRVITIETTTDGAVVYRKPYTTPQAEWEHLGRTPIRDLRIPRGFSRWKITRDGYQTIEFAGNQMDTRATFGLPPETLRFSLGRPGDTPEGMVRVAGGPTVLQIPGLEGIPPVTIADYFIDKYEVTNREFKAFVDAGGYQKPEHWKQPFVRGARVLPWNEAITLFRDKTGKPGPAGWELSEFAPGQADYPVTGISWFEAAAYAEYAHKSLPTAYQWSRAAGTLTSFSMIPFSNFSGQTTTPRAASQALSPAGIYDTAGNAKEWCWNASGEGHLILGGGFNEPAYMFNDWDSKSPFERGLAFGVRLVRPVPGLDSPKEALDSVPTAFRDYRKEKPVSDAVFQIFKSLYAYDKTPLSPKIEAVEDTAEWRREKVSYRAGYGDERILAHVFIPKRSSAPYQTVVLFPGATALQQTSSEPASWAASLHRFDYLVKSGRALIFPIYKGTYERRDELASDHPVPSGLYRDHVIMWSKDLGRTIDYLETRTDLDARKIAYYGFSWGGTMGAILPALEPRVKVVVVESGGLYSEKTLPEVDQINFAPRVKQPVLMINAHYDHFFPLETSQIPLFHFFGAPEKDKRHVVEEGWHVLPRHLVIREALPWLDRYLGPVK